MKHFFYFFDDCWLQQVIVATIFKNEPALIMDKEPNKTLLVLLILSAHPFKVPLITPRMSFLKDCLLLNSDLGQEA